MAKLLIYNPTCDMAVENGTYSYMPSKLLSKFEADISPLMGFLGSSNDYILYDTSTPNEFITFWEQLGIHLPQLISFETIKDLTIDAIYPWGWSQIIHHRYAKPYGLNSLPLLEQSNSFKQFFSRQTSIELIHELNKQALPDFVSIPILPQIVTSSQTIQEALSKTSEGIVLKTLWSSSGRGLLFLHNMQQFQKSLNWIEAQLKKQGSLILEPIYDKVQDASLQFNITPEGNIEFLGLNFFDADSQGHFCKEYFHLPASVVNELPQSDEWLQTTSRAIIDSMKKLSIHNKYHGPIGIDTMFILNKNKQLKFYPLVEANLRCNMGLINLYIKKLIHHQSSGTWQISQFKPGQAPAFYKEQLTMHPVDQQDNLITKGFIPLSPFTADTCFAAWGLVKSNFSLIN